jgi:hypothetical protein
LRRRGPRTRRPLAAVGRHDPVAKLRLERWLRARGYGDEADRVRIDAPRRRASPEHELERAADSPQRGNDWRGPAIGLVRAQHEREGDDLAAPEVEQESGAVCLG